MFPESFSGDDSTLMKTVGTDENVRKTTASSWSLTHSGEVLQVRICRVVAVEAGSACEWISAALNESFRGKHVSFKSKIRDAGH